MSISIRELSHLSNDADYYNDELFGPNYVIFEEICRRIRLGKFRFINPNTNQMYTSAELKHTQTVKPIATTTSSGKGLSMRQFIGCNEIICSDMTFIFVLISLKAFALLEFMKKNQPELFDTFVKELHNKPCWFHYYCCYLASAKRYNLLREWIELCPTLSIPSDAVDELPDNGTFIHRRVIIPAETINEQVASFI